MATSAITPTASLLDEKLKKSSPGAIGTAIFGVMLVGGLIYIGHALSKDLSIPTRSSRMLPSSTPAFSTSSACSPAPAPSLSPSVVS